MLINLLPRLSYNQYKRDSQTSYSSEKLFLRPQLSADTLSFGAKLPKYDNTFFMDALSRGYDSAEPNFIAKAHEFHDALKRTVEKLKAYGFEYDEAYNSACPVKKKKSVLDKYERQGSAQDIIRGTVYWQDQQDVSSFKKFHDLMKEEGWELAPLRKSDEQTGDFIRNKNGTIIKFPDLEIRQEGITAETLAPLGEFIQRAEISKPRPSTYSDWQMRFIKTHGKGMKEGRQDCELIFLYGPHYKDAKEIEHKYVYEPVRKLKKLHVDMNPDHHQKGSAGHIIASNFNGIQKRLVQFISQPLYFNAFNADLKIKDAEKLPVEVSKAYSNLILNYAKAIKKSIPVYYKQISAELLNQEKITESIKASPSYQFRTDKTISKKEFKDTKSEIKNRLVGWKEKDIEILNQVLADLSETLEKFGVKS